MEELVLKTNYAEVKQVSFSLFEYKIKHCFYFGVMLYEKYTSLSITLKFSRVTPSHYERLMGMQRKVDLHLLSHDQYRYKLMSGMVGRIAYTI